MADLVFGKFQIYLNRAGRSNKQNFRVVFVFYDSYIS